MDLYDENGEKVAEYIARGSFPVGYTLVKVNSNGIARMFCINPDYAAVMAVIEECREDIINSILNEIEYTAAGVDREKLMEIFNGNPPRVLNRPSSQHIVDKLRDIIFKKIVIGESNDRRSF